jgi:ABC-type lipoprotein export system ATPase subunit
MELLRDAAHEDGIAVIVFTREPAIGALADRVERLEQGRLGCASLAVAA